MLSVLPVSRYNESIALRSLVLILQYNTLILCFHIHIKRCGIIEFQLYPYLIILVRVFWDYVVGTGCLIDIRLRQK